MIRKNPQSVAKNPQTIVTDGVKISLKGQIDTQQKGYRMASKNVNLKFRGYGHKNFGNVAEMYYKGELLGSLDLEPRSLLPADTVILNVHNKIQYSKGWTAKIKAALKELNLSFRHFGRLDIAVDAPDRGQFKFIDKVIAGKLIQVGNTRFSPIYDGKNDDGTPRLMYFTFGSRSSDKFMRAYYKRQELAQSNKYYIQEFWEDNGFEIGEDTEVTRFEMVLKRKELKKYIGLSKDLGPGLDLSNLELLEDPEYLATIFNTAKEKFFEFASRRSFMRTGNITRAKKIKVLDLSGICTRLLEKVKAKVSTAIYAAKISAKFLFMLCCKTCDERYMKEIEESLYNFNLTRWFEANRERFHKEFSLKYESDHFEFLTNYTSKPSFVQSEVWDQNRPEFKLDRALIYPSNY